MMDRDLMVRQLRGIQEKYEGRHTPTFQIVISDMVRDCADALESQQSEIKQLEAKIAELERNQNPDIKYAMTHGITLERLEAICDAEKDGRCYIAPCKVGDTVYVDSSTMPYDYLLPTEEFGRFARCEVISFRITKTEAVMKLKALYPSRIGKKQYLTYLASDFGMKVFPSKESAKLH